MSDTVQIYGVNKQGIQVHIGEATMPARMKFKEILRSYLGNPGDEDSDATMALAAYDDLVVWQRANQSLNTISNLGIAGLAVKNFGNPIPKEAYTFAADLLESIGVK